MVNLCECGCGRPAKRRFVHGHNSNSRRGQFAGGRFIDNEGYARVYVGRDHPMAFSTGYAFEHRLVVAEREGRMLDRAEVIHHINEVRDDNRLENLLLLPRPGAHNAYHNRRWGSRAAKA